MKDLEAAISVARNRINKGIVNFYTEVSRIEDHIRWHPLDRNDIFTRFNNRNGLLEFIVRIISIHVDVLSLFVSTEKI